MMTLDFVGFKKMFVGQFPGPLSCLSGASHVQCLQIIAQTFFSMLHLHLVKPYSTMSYAYAVMDMIQESARAGRINPGEKR